MNRRESLLKLGLVGMTALSSGHLSLKMQNVLKRPIPSTEELLPAVGLGTWQTFDVNDSDEELAPLREVLKTLILKGAKVVDSSPMYGRSEKVVGDLSTAENINAQLFIATKVWTSGVDEGKKQMQRSFELLRRSKVDLMQVHNLVDWQNHLRTLQSWKDEGKVRYIGVTHYLDSMHDKLESIIRTNKIDFIQVNYSIASRNAEKRLLPFARENNVAVIINRPFEEGALFQRVQGKALPPFAREMDCSSWGQFFLKFILSNENVTCVIPGTSKVKHLIDNLSAGEGRLPNAKEREEMIRLIS
jgi:diketogulonate reductase-like aldo/keto reductase